MRLFGSERLMDVFTTLGVPENEQIQHGMLTSAIEKAQQKIERITLVLERTYWNMIR